MDQVLAAHFDDVTTQPSLVLGCEQPITGYHESNFSMAYSSHISWQNANSPVPMEVYPSLAFDSLFDNQGSRRSASILDRVRDQASALNGQVSHADRAKLDEYLTSVREVERRIERNRTQGSGGTRPNANAMRRPENGLPEDIREHMRLMCDIIALAFQTDRTRVATLLLCRDLSGLFYPFLNVRTAHHPTSHEDSSEAYERVTRYYVSQLAYLAGRLAEMREGDSTVLDNSCLMFLSNMWSGSRHDSSKLPVLLVGGLGGALATGRVLDFTERGDENRKLCSLHLALLNRMGVAGAASATPPRRWLDCEWALPRHRSCVSPGGLQTANQSCTTETYHVQHAVESRDDQQRSPPLGMAADPGNLADPPWNLRPGVYRRPD